MMFRTCSERREAGRGGGAGGGGGGGRVGLESIKRGVGLESIIYKFIN